MHGAWLRPIRLTGGYVEARQVTRECELNAGIPGIKYLDQGSRAAGQGSSNYVVFNDKLIDILRKYGLAGAAATGAMSSGFWPATAKSHH